MALVVVVTLNANETDGTGGVRLNPTLVGHDGTTETETVHGLDRVGSRTVVGEADTHTRLNVGDVERVDGKGPVAVLVLVHTESLQGVSGEVNGFANLLIC